MIDFVGITGRMLAVSASDIIAISNRSHVVRARQICALVMSEYGLTHYEIGEGIQRDHTTACYSIKKAKQHEQSSPAFANELQAVRIAVRVASDRAFRRGILAIAREHEQAVTDTVR